VSPHNIKTNRFNKKFWLLSSACTIFVLIITGGLFTARYLSSQNKQPSQPAAQSNDWQAEDSKLKEAQKLVSENNLDEAIIVLAQIDKNYPRYAEVIKLQKTVDVKKVEIAKINTATQLSSVAPAPTPPFVTPIQIRGDAACQASTIEALKLLNQKAPTHYETVTRYVKVIECASQGSGMFAYENPPRYLVGDATRNAGTIWYTGTIAHEAGHSKLYHEYLNTHPGSSVPNEIWTGQSAEKTCLEAQYDALSKIGGTQSQLDYVRNVINSQYYDVPYDQRWW